MEVDFNISASVNWLTTLILNSSPYKKHQHHEKGVEDCDETYLLSGNKGTRERASSENSGASEPIGGDILVHDWEVRDGPNSTEHTQRESERDKPDGGVSLHDYLCKEKRESA